MFKKKNDKGLSLIELIVSIAILAIVVLPLLTAFLVSLRTNAKAKEKLRAVEIAHNFMEGMEATPVTEILTQLNYPKDKFNLLANYDDTLVSYEFLDNGSEYTRAIRMEDISPEIANRDKLVTGSIVRYGLDDYKFVAHDNGKYYFYLTNIPSDGKRKRYSAMITIDAATDVTTKGTAKQKYNSFSVTDMESMDPRYDAFSSDIITTSKLLTDINLQQSLHMTYDDLKYLTRTIRITIEHPNENSNEAKVTVAYSYKCKDYPVVDAEGNPVLEIDTETLKKQKLESFDFPTDACTNKEDYTIVLYDNSGAKASADNYLKNVYLFYQPWYVSTQTDPLSMKDNIIIDNLDDYDCTVKLIKQKWINDAELGLAEQNYHVKVELNEGIRSGTAHVKFETNLGTNISDDDSFTDLAAANQAVYVYNRSTITASNIYNAAHPSPAVSKDTCKLWVSTGFGIDEERDRLYDVTVDIYPNPDDMKTQLNEIHGKSVQPIVTLSGGLMD